MTEKTASVAKKPQSEVPAKPKPAVKKTAVQTPLDAQAKPAESGGPKGPEPTRYGDWERDGRCVDF